MTIMSVVGARPNFMKAAPIIAAIGEHNNRLSADGGPGQGLSKALHHILVHTGQHYDQFMSGRYWAQWRSRMPTCLP